MLRGASGCGKSTFARLLALEQAHALPRATNEAALPIWLDLALCEDKQGSVDALSLNHNGRLLSYWQHWLEGHQAFLRPGQLERLSRVACPNLAAEVANWIDASPNQRFVLLADRPRQR